MHTNQPIHNLIILPTENFLRFLGTPAQIEKLQGVIDVAKKTCIHPKQMCQEISLTGAQKENINGKQQSLCRETQSIGVGQNHVFAQENRGARQRLDNENTLIRGIEPSPRPSLHIHDQWMLSPFISPPGRPPTTEYFLPDSLQMAPLSLSCELGTVARPAADSPRLLHTPTMHVSHAADEIESSPRPAEYPNELPQTLR